MHIISPFYVFSASLKILVLHIGFSLEFPHQAHLARSSSLLAAGCYSTKVQREIAIFRLMQPANFKYTAILLPIHFSVPFQNFSYKSSHDSLIAGNDLICLFCSS